MKKGENTYIIQMGDIMVSILLESAYSNSIWCKNLYEGLAIGSQVMFAGGIYGRVVGIEEETVNVEIAKGAIMKIDRFAIQAIVK